MTTIRDEKLLSSSDFKTDSNSLSKLNLRIGQLNRAEYAVPRPDGKPWTKRALDMSYINSDQMQVTLQLYKHTGNLISNVAQ